MLLRDHSTATRPGRPSPSSSTRRAKTFRDDLYDRYKATRDADAEDLVGQSRSSSAIPAALRDIAPSRSAAWRPDDVIGTLAPRGALARGLDVGDLVTGDKDFMPSS